MATSKIPTALALLVVLFVTAAYSQQNNCAGTAAGAKYRWQVLIQPKDPKADSAKADAALKKWLVEDCKKALSAGTGPATMTSSSVYGCVYVSNESV